MNLLITGASTGIGEACARWFDARGHRVFAGVRRDEDAGRLRQGASPLLRPVRIDVTDAATIRAAVDEVASLVRDEGLDGLVNNAGIALAGPLEHVPLDALRRQLDVNVVGQIAVTQAALPLLRGARGRVVFMGSIGGRMCTPFLGPYCASKFALEAIADALRVELQPWGIHVAIIEPGSIATPIWTKSAAETSAMLDAGDGRLEEQYGEAMAAIRRVAAETGRRGISPDAVAEVVNRALTSPAPRTRYLVGRDAKVRAFLGSFVPDRIRDRLLTRFIGLPGRGTRAVGPRGHRQKLTRSGGPGHS